MPKDKSTGKKLADMLYGNPERAAFGVFPQLGRRGQAKPAPRQARSAHHPQSECRNHVPWPKYGALHGFVHATH